MTDAFALWLRIAFVGSVLLPLVVISCTLFSIAGVEDWQRLIFAVVVPLFAWLLYRTCQKPFAKFAVKLEQHSARYSNFLDSVPERYVGLAIVISAALSLILELSLIRWQSSEFEFFAFYKNVSLIACFAGLGAGYGPANKKHVPLILCIPLLLWQVALLVFLRHGLDLRLLRCLLAMPITEQLTMGLGVDLTPVYFVGIYFFLTVVILLTALTPGASRTALWEICLSRYCSKVLRAQSYRQSSRSSFDRWSERVVDSTGDLVRRRLPSFIDVPAF